MKNESSSIILILCCTAYRKVDMYNGNRIPVMSYHNKQSYHMNGMCVLTVTSTAGGDGVHCTLVGDVVELTKTPMDDLRIAQELHVDGGRVSHS